MLKIESLTTELVAKFISEVHKDNPCIFCGSVDSLSVLSDEDDNIVYSELQPFNVFGDKHPKLNSVPIIPLMCKKCGHTTNLVSHAILEHLNQEGYNE